MQAIIKLIYKPEYGLPQFQIIEATDATLKTAQPNEIFDVAKEELEWLFTTQGEAKALQGRLLQLVGSRSLLSEHTNQLYYKRFMSEL
jgi:hypothetical protein